jgi:Outer membrane lipoprotein-sorting protein
MRIEHEDSPAAIGERSGRERAGKAGADDRNVVIGTHSWIHFEHNANTRPADFYFCPLPFSGREVKIPAMVMWRLRSVTVLIPCLLPLYYVSAGPLVPQTETAEWVARQVDNRDIGKDGRFELKMRLFDRQQRVRERELSIQTMRPQGRGQSGTKSTDAGDRILIRFTYPNDIKGTSFLVWEHPGTEDERFLYLPALGRVRRITGAEAQDSFVGSDFTYEDISGRELDEYTYGMVEQNGSWIGSDGKPVPVYRIESRAKNAQARFPRVVSTVRKDNFVAVHADIYNRRNEKEKVYEVKRLELVQSIWTLSEIVMTDTTARTHTELSVTNVRYNLGLKEDDFSRRELERK